MIKKIGIIMVLALVAWFIGSSMHLEKQEKTPEALSNTGEISSQKNIKKTETKNMKAIVKTNKGDIEITLKEEGTPKTVENFVKLAKEGFYDGTKFHRVIKGFMIQGGDPLSKDDNMMDRWGTGGPGYQFDDEISSDNHNNKGTIAMANAGPNTNGSQFFINVADNNFLDTKHTVFGKVTQGMDIVEAIESTETFPDDKPVEAVIVESIEISEA